MVLGCRQSDHTARSAGSQEDPDQEDRRQRQVGRTARCCSRLILRASDTGMTMYMVSEWHNIGRHAQMLSEQRVVQGRGTHTQ